MVDTTSDDWPPQKIKISEQTTAEPRPAPPAGSIAWSKERPTEPGWWWYADEYYGPAPIYLAWTGFIKRPEQRELNVDMAVGEDQEILGQPVADLDGEWYLLQEPPKQ